MIQTIALTKEYKMGGSAVKALRGIDLEIAEGEFVAIMGPSGSGKTTLLNIVGCLDRPTAGTYLLDGRNVSSLGDRELAAVRNGAIGFVFQTFNLLPRKSALANVEVPLMYGCAGRSRGRAEKALESVGLTDRAGHRPSEMSGGQQQRVAIARAIVNDPKLILCDEPTGNLDSHTSEEIMAVFQELNRQGKTIVLVTHEEDIARHCRRVIGFRDGMIVRDETVAEPVDALKVLSTGRWGGSA